MLKINSSIIFSREEELLILKRVFDTALLNGDLFHNGIRNGCIIHRDNGRASFPFEQRTLN